MKSNEVCEMVDLPKRKEMEKVLYANTIIFAMLLGWLIDTNKDINFRK